MLLTIFIFILIIVAFVYTIKAKAEKYDLIKQKEKERDNFLYMKDNNIPPDANSCFIMSEGKEPAYAWKERENIKVFENNKEYNKIIPIENIQYYARTGDCNIQTITEGGGISISKAIIGSIVGAVIGFIVFSSIGAIIGIAIGALLAGKEKTITKQQEIDKRQTYLYYNEENQEKRIVFDSSAYDTFINLIPNKNIEYIQQRKIIN